MTHLCRILLLFVVLALIAGCASGSPVRPPSWSLPNPADLLTGFIEQISGIGDSLSRQFRRMTPKW